MLRQRKVGLPVNAGLCRRLEILPVQWYYYPEAFNVHDAVEIHGSPPIRCTFKSNSSGVGNESRIPGFQVSVSRAFDTYLSCGAPTHSATDTPSWSSCIGSLREPELRACFPRAASPLFAKLDHVMKKSGTVQESRPATKTPLLHIMQASSGCIVSHFAPDCAECCRTADAVYVRSLLAGPLPRFVTLG